MKNRKTVVDLIPTSARIYPVGRLDYDTTGALLLTNDGEFANILMPIMGNLSYINYVVTAVVGAILVVNGKMSGVATLIPFLNLSRQFSMPLTQISQQFN